MAKKKKDTFQLLPLEYLLKIGRIKKAPHGGYQSKDTGICIPEQMQQDWKNSIGKDIKIFTEKKYSYLSTKDNETFKWWHIEKKWCKP